MKKPKSVLWVQIFIAFLAISCLPALWQQLSRSPSLFASLGERLRFYSFTAFLLVIPVGAIWAIGSIQLRRPGARLNTALLLALLLAAALRRLPPAATLQALAGGRLSGGALGAAAWPVILGLLTALLLIAMLFDPLLRRYLASRPDGASGVDLVHGVPQRLEEGDHQEVAEPGRQNEEDERRRQPDQGVLEPDFFEEQSGDQDRSTESRQAGENPSTIRVDLGSGLPRPATRATMALRCSPSRWPAQRM